MWVKSDTQELISTIFSMAMYCQRGLLLSYYRATYHHFLFGLRSTDVARRSVTQSKYFLESTPPVPSTSSRKSSTPSIWIGVHCELSMRKFSSASGCRSCLPLVFWKIAILDTNLGKNTCYKGPPFLLFKCLNPHC